MTVFDKRAYYKPFAYPWAYDIWLQHEKMHWLPDEVLLTDDVRDWHTRTSEGEKRLLTALFRFFTQADVDVARGYMEIFGSLFGHPELRMMLSGFAAREAVHQAAYSNLIDTLGLPEDEYQRFAEYEAMAAKHRFVERFLAGERTPESVGRALAVYAAFTEGMQLYSSFALLLHFSRADSGVPQHLRGRYTGMSQIIAWSVRDESVHVDGNLRLFREMVREFPGIWTDDYRATLYQIARDMVALEDAFIDLCFDGVELYGLDSAQLKQYIRFVADKRLLQLGLKQNWGVDEHPLPWMDVMLGAVEHANFFEVRATEYAKSALSGSWDDVWGSASKNF